MKWCVDTATTYFKPSRCMLLFKAVEIMFTAVSSTVLYHNLTRTHSRQKYKAYPYIHACKMQGVIHTSNFSTSHFFPKLGIMLLSRQCLFYCRQHYIRHKKISAFLGDSIKLTLVLSEINSNVERTLSI